MKTREDKRMVYLEFPSKLPFMETYLKIFSRFTFWCLVHIWFTPGEGPKGFVNWFSKISDHGSWTIKSDHEKKPSFMVCDFMFHGPNRPLVVRCLKPELKIWTLFVSGASKCYPTIVAKSISKILRLVGLSKFHIQNEGSRTSLTIYILAHNIMQPASLWQAQTTPHQIKAIIQTHFCQPTFELRN